MISKIDRSNIKRKKVLFILPFDHRSSFEKDLFGIRNRPPTDEEAAEISEYKKMIYEGFKRAIVSGVSKENVGILVDEEFGSEILNEAKAEGYITACSVEKSGQEELEFEYGSNFEEHILRICPDYVKVLIRYNPQGDAEMNNRQAHLVKTLSNFCSKNGFDLMVELLVPPTFAQAWQLTGDVSLFEREIKPKVIVAAIKDLQEKGAEPKSGR